MIRKLSTCNIIVEYDIIFSKAFITFIRPLPFSSLEALDMTVKVVKQSLNLQVMSLHSSLHLPPPVPVVPSPSDVMLLGTGVDSPSGE